MLGEVDIERAEVKSLELLGSINHTEIEINVGVLLLVLKNRNLKPKIILQAADSSSKGIVQINKYYKTTRKLNKGDVIALYLPKVGKKFIQIVTSSQPRRKFKFLKGSKKNIITSWSKLKEQRAELIKNITKKTWSNWMEIEGDLNVRVIIGE